MTTIYPDNTYANRFHELIAAGGYKSRVLIYSVDIDDLLQDIWSRPMVENYGTLLKYNVSDTDSNGRIGQNGIKIYNYYNKEEEYTIGNAPVSQIEINLINDDGYFSTFDWTKVFAIYWDVYDPDNGGSWIGVSLGVYRWERPTKTNAIIVIAKANDFMWTLHEDYPAVELNYSSGLNLAQVYTGVVSRATYVIPYPNPENWPNMTIATYYSQPFDLTNMTSREQLAKLAEIAGSNAYVSRDGYVMLKPFTNATWQNNGTTTYYTLDGDACPTNIINIDIGEYTVPVIDEFIAQVGQSGEVYTSGTGSNTMYSINNGYLNIATASAQATVGGMYGVVSGQHPSSDMGPYVPLCVKAYGDPSVEAGDVIRVIRGGVTYNMPIFQQTLFWNGADWIVEMQNSGNLERLIPSEAKRSDYLIRAEISNVSNTKTGSFNPATGVTVSEQDIKQVGNCVYIHFYVTGTFAAGTSYNIGSVSGISTPSQRTRWLTGGGANPYNATTPVYATLSTTGGVNIYSDTAIGAANITISYII